MILTVKLMRQTITLLALSSLFLFGCQVNVPSEDVGTVSDSSVAAAALSDEDMAAHAALTLKIERAFLEADMELMASCYTEDAVLMGPNEPVIVGRDGIIEMFSGFPPLTSVSIKDIEVVGFGDYAYVRGSVEMTMDIPGLGEYTEIGKILEIRQRQSDGSWLITRDMYSSDMPLEQE